MRTAVVGGLATAFLGAVIAPCALGIAATPDSPTRDDAVVDAFQQTSRSTEWQLEQRIPLRFPSHHPQGLASVGDRLFLSTVEIIEKPQKYPEPVDGYDRSPGRGVGHVLVLDRQGNLIRDVVLGEGAMYHPGGIDFDGESLWVPVAEYRPNSSSIVYRLNPGTLQAEEAFRVSDHVGGTVRDRVTGTVHGVSWGSRTLYRWTAAGREISRQDNAGHFIDYQDCDYAASQTMICGGIAELPTADRGAFELGGLALVDLRDNRIRHEVPMQERSAAGHVATRNPVHLEHDAGTLRLWSAPDDGDEAGGTELLVHRATTDR